MRSVRKLSLRSFLLSIVLLSVCFAILDCRTRAQQLAVKDILTRGGHVTNDNSESMDSSYRCNLFCTAKTVELPTRAIEGGLAELLHRLPSLDRIGFTDFEGYDQQKLADLRFQHPDMTVEHPIDMIIELMRQDKTTWSAELFESIDGDD